MKRKAIELDEGDRLSNLLFSKSKDLTEKLKSESNNDLDANQKPAWVDQDDEEYRASIIPNVKSDAPYTEKLKQKYETLMGTPSWAKLTKESDIQDEDEITKTVGHLIKKSTGRHLPKDIIEINRLPKVNAETKNEGPVITAIEFHPKLSVTLVTGTSGIVSLFSIGGETNSKLHSFKLKQFKPSSAHFTPDGSNVFVSSTTSHSYCIYNLVKAAPELVQLPQCITRATIFQMSPDGQLIAASPGFEEICVLSAESRELLKMLKHNTKVVSVSFSSDCKHLYSYTEQGEVVVWDMSTFRVVKKFYDHGCVTASRISCSPCGKLLATGSGEGIVNIYETDKLNDREPIPLKSISNLKTKITGLKFNATSEILATASGYYPNSVKLVHVPSYHVFSNFPDQSFNMYQCDFVSFSPNSGYMACGNNKHCAYLYRLKYYKNY